MTEPTPTPEQQNSPATPDPEKTPPDSADKTGFFNRVRQNLHPKPIHPSEEQEIVVEMTPIERTDSDGKT